MRLRGCTLTPDCYVQLVAYSTSDFEWCQFGFLLIKLYAWLTDTGHKALMPGVSVAETGIV